MDKQRVLSAALVAGALTIMGCGEPPEYTEDDGAIPAGAVPASPDTRPAIEPELGEIEVGDTAAAAGTGQPPAAGAAGAAGMPGDSL